MFKKLRLPIIAAITAIALAFGVSAFTGHKAKPVAKKFFTSAYYHLSTDNASDENTLNKWVYDGAVPIACTPGITVLCSVLAPDKLVGTTHVIDPAFITTPINMRTDPNVTNLVKKP